MMTKPLSPIYFKLVIFTCLIILSFAFSRKNLSREFDAKQVEKELCLIPGGKFKGGKAPLLKGFKATKDARKVIAIDTFYLSNHEITNREYWIFLDDVRSDDSSNYKRMLPDTLTWRTEMGFNDDYIELYFRHPAYAHYPVVGVSHEQASFYCNWLTEKYNQYKKRKHRNAVFKLPTKLQWEYAAQGGTESKIPTANGSLEDKKRFWQANFQVISQTANKIDTLKLQSSEHQTPYDIKGIEQPFTYSSISDLYFEEITCEVFRFKTNAYGLYNMAGNVAEYVQEKGILKGGSWMTTGYYLFNYTEQYYDVKKSSSTNERGFRVAMEYFSE